MSSKLPKPSASRLPQVRRKPLGTYDNNALGTIPENRGALSVQKTRAFEAPPSTYRAMPALGSNIRRRSKSCTDLRVTNSLKPLKKFELDSKHTIQNKTANKMPIKASSAKSNVVTTGTKRPLANKASDDAPKAKVSKNIAAWDYKGRFNQLSEKYKVSQERIKEMTTKVAEYDELQVNYAQVTKEVNLLKEVKAALEEKCDGYDHLKEQFAELTLKYEKLKEEHEILIEKCDIQEKEIQLSSKEIERINTCHEELKNEHQKLSDDHEKQTVQVKDLSEKYSSFLERNKNLAENLDAEQQENERLNEVVLTMKAALTKFETERRTLHNTIQDLKGNIRVFCRVRPPLQSEIEKLQCSISFIDENGLEIRKSRESVSQITGKTQEVKSEFTFDKVFSDESTQEEIFEDLAQLVQSALDGYDVCVFAYGQTGSGKTYTMQGGEGPDRGMIPRTIQLIFQTIANLKNMARWEYKIHASFLEIYNENVRDLLNMNSGQKLDIYFNEGKGTTVANLTMQPIESATELEKFMRLAQNNRATAATDFNEHSSRSHAVTKIYLEGTFKDQNTIYRGSINLVDLAGSESAKTSAMGERLTETKNINKSLSTLGDVISALYNKSKHIPYRNSKLTYLLQSCLGGNSKTLMFVNVAPFEECYGESISSLRFAAKVKEVKTGSKRNKMVGGQPGGLLKQKTIL